MNYALQSKERGDKVVRVVSVTYPEIFWEYRFWQEILGQEPKRT